MHQKSDGTFLWVALVIEELRQVLGLEMFEALEEMPSGSEGDGENTMILISFGAGPLNTVPF
jgi:hypothetical protein